MTDKKEATMTKHANIHAALLAAQPKFKKPQKTKENDHFKNKYADLEAMVDAVKPALNGEGIVYFHVPETSEIGEVVVTVLHHVDSGTEIRCPVPLFLGKRDSQGYKSASTYAKRVGLEDATGVAPTDDDDAEGAGGNPFSAGTKDAWIDGVLDSLPENATSAEKAEAFANQICADFTSKKSLRGLEGEWKKRGKLIENFQDRFSGLYAKVFDTYEECARRLSPAQEAAE